MLEQKRQIIGNYSFTSALSPHKIPCGQKGHFLFSWKSLIQPIALSLGGFSIFNPTNTRALHIVFFTYGAFLMTVFESSLSTSLNCCKLLVSEQSGK